MLVQGDVVGKASEQLQHERGPVHHVELPAGELYRLREDSVVGVLVVYSNQSRQDSRVAACGKRGLEAVAALKQAAEAHDSVMGQLGLLR